MGCVHWCYWRRACVGATDADGGAGMSEQGQSDDVRRLLERARFYAGCGLRDAAREFLEQATSLAPGDASVQAAIARIGGKSVEVGRTFEIEPPRRNNDDPRKFLAEAVASRDFQAARAHARRIAEAAPGDAKAWAALAVIERRAANFDAALAAHDKAIGLDPERSSFAHARAKTLWEAGRYADAEAAYESLLTGLSDDDPSYADARMCLGMIRMTQHGPAAGVEDYEWRWRTREARLPDATQPYWDGSPQPDKRILFFGEQGFGDAIQFARYAPLVAGRCARVVMPCKPPLQRLMQSLGGAVEVIGEKVHRNAFDLYVPAMSCMRLLGAELPTLPKEVPYLAAGDDDVARFRPVMEGHDGLRIGIAWTGSPTNAHDWKRAIEPGLFSALADVPGTSLFSLQKLRDDTPAVLRAAPSGAVDLSALLADFADTAAAIQCLDLVITADTSVAHLAGALGKPVWVMLSKVPDWRWMADRDDSPWYPTMRLYRQPAFGDWAEVMARVAADLAVARTGDSNERRKGRFTRLLPWRR